MKYDDLMNEDINLYIAIYKILYYKKFIENHISLKFLDKKIY